MALLRCAVSFACLLLLSTDLSAQTLPAPHPIAPAGAIVNPPRFSDGTRGFHTFVFTAVPGTHQYQVYARSTWIWVTAADAQCANGETICRVKWSVVFTTVTFAKIDYWWVRAWAPDNGYSPWSPAVEVNVGTSTSASMGGDMWPGNVTHAAMEDERAKIDALAREKAGAIKKGDRSGVTHAAFLSAAPNSPTTSSRLHT